MWYISFDVSKQGYVLFLHAPTAHQVFLHQSDISPKTLPHTPGNLWTYRLIQEKGTGTNFHESKPLLESGGVYISSELGPKAQNLFLALITPIIGNKKVIFPIPTNCVASVLLIKKLSEEGKFVAVIDRKYSLEEIAEAYRYVEKGQKIGNVVITIEGS